MNPPRRTRDAAETRAGILDAAERLFAERGFDATPTSAIAEAAGVPKGLLFYYFATKSQLLRALVAERMSLGPVDVDALAEPGDPARSLLNLTAKIRELEEPRMRCSSPERSTSSYRQPAPEQSAARSAAIW